MNEEISRNKVIGLFQNKLLYALAVTFLCFAVIYSFYTPTWETNDDIAMSMAAHGYGMAAAGTPNIIYSNVIWGWLVRLTPTINGVLGYSVVAISVLVVTAVTFIYFMTRAGVNVLCVASVMALVMYRPILFPQFTLNAGLLSVAAVLCWCHYGRYRSRQACVAAFLFSCCGYLTRSQEFILVMLIALPLLPLKSMYADRFCRFSVYALFLCLITFFIVDRQAYQGESWKDFNELNSVRMKFTDFKAGDILKQEDEILERNNYSSNDIDLVSNFFFVDPKVADPELLSSMLSQVSFFPETSAIKGNVVQSIKALRHRALLPLTLAALALLVLFPSRRLFLSWALFVSAIVLLGALGRPAILRVYLPVLALLILAPLLMGRLEKNRHRLVSFILLIGASANSYWVSAEAGDATLASKKYTRELQYLSSAPLMVWGSGFPYESIYPVLGDKNLHSMDLNIHWLSVFTLAPFSIWWIEQQQGRSFEKMITSTDGIKIVGAKIKLLERYCQEHFDLTLKHIGREDYGLVNVEQIRCGQ